MADQVKILFVDDEPNLLSGLKRMLRKYRKEWDMAFAEGGPQALEVLAQQPFDIVVSDMKMPEVDGAALLLRVANDHPSTVRIILSGQSEHQQIMKVVDVAHQFRSKPCDAEKLCQSIRQVCQLQQRLADPLWRNRVTQMGSLPTQLDIKATLTCLLDEEQPDLQQVIELACSDLGFSSKVMQLTSSSFFGSPLSHATPQQACELLGIPILKELLLDGPTFEACVNDSWCSQFIQQICQHSARVAAAAKQIAEQESDDVGVINDSFTAGWFHDVGKIIMALFDPDSYQQTLRLAQEQQISLWQAEREVFGLTHAEIGGYVLGLWGLETRVVDVVSFYREPEKLNSEQFGPLEAVYAANHFLRAPDWSGDQPTETVFESEHLRQLGLADRVSEWHQQIKGLSDTAAGQPSCEDVS